MQLKNVGEFPLIDILSKQSKTSQRPVIRSIGDDAAVISSRRDHCFLVSTDILREGIHFKKSFGSPYLLGKKCLAANLSDIAAMGGTPFCYLISLSAPPDTPLKFIKDLYRGMNRKASEFETVLVGGDTVSSSGDIVISVTVIGRASGEKIVYRTGARSGDRIYVSGHPGDAALGLLMLERDSRAFRRCSAVRKHLDPVPRVLLGKALADQKLAGSMIDISDGLIADLGHITAQSGVGAEIHLSRLPLSSAYRKRHAGFSQDLYGPVLFGGEDYELLFTASIKNSERIMRLAKKLKTPITCIGKIVARPKKIIVWDRDHKIVRLKNRGFTHF